MSDPKQATSNSVATLVSPVKEGLSSANGWTVWPTGTVVKVLKTEDHYGLVGETLNLVETSGGHRFWAAGREISHVDSRIAAFEEVKFLLEVWYGCAWGSSVTPADEDVLDSLKKIADEFPGHGALR